MGLVDYSESESSGSEAETPVKSIAKPKPRALDKSKSGKILVNLAGDAAAAPSASSDEPPAKRARTAGGGRFAGFNSFLPAPKNLKPAAAAGSSKAPGVGLRTSAAPGFSRDAGAAPSLIADTDAADGADDGSVPRSSGLSLPPPKSAVADPSIPEGQKPASEVKLTGKPLMFRPLSVAKGKKKKTTAAAASPKPTEAKTVPTPSPAAELSKKKMSLFSIPSDDTAPAPGPSLPSSSGAYEPLFENDTATTSDDYNASAYAAAEPVTESIGDMADDMNLSAAARRELFGRGGSNTQAAAAQRVVNFNMDREYRHNEALRASGELQPTHNPVRSIQGGGKHSLRQLVTNVQGQKDALEDSFAKGRSNRREASSRYGW